MGDLRSWPPNAQFDVATTSFTTLTALKELMVSSTKDDVQPMAIIAAEQLGSSILICAERHDEAVDALNGDESVRLESVRATVGLSSGGTRKHVRESPRLLAVFCLCAALKLAYLDEEIASLLFLMMGSSQVLQSHATSRSQLCSFVTQIAGHCEKIVPMALMHQIAVDIAPFDPGPKPYMRFNDRELASLLIHLFKNYRDEDIEEVSLEGSQHAIWLASTLLWILGESKVRITVNNKFHIRGDINAPVHLNIVTDDPPNAWTRTIWKAGKEVKAYTYATDEAEELKPNRMPRLMLKSHYENNFLPDLFSLRERQLIVETMGVAIEGMILGMYTLGRLALPQCSQGSTEGCKHCTTTLCDVIGSDSATAASDLVATFGWTTSKSAQSQVTRLGAVVYQALYLLNCPRAGIKLQAFNRCFENFISQTLYDQLSRGGSSFVKSVILKDICAQANWVAIDAVLTSTCRMLSGNRYCKFPNGADLTRAASLTSHLLGDGLSLDEFREAAFTSALPGYSKSGHRDLVVSHNGYVAGWGVLWDMSMLKQDAVSLHVQRGGIRHEGFVYERIAEQDTGTQRFSMNPVLHAEMQRSKSDALSYLCFSDQDTPNSSNLDFHMPVDPFQVELMPSISVLRKTLFIRHSLLAMNISSGTTTKHRFSWIDSANGLATATHLGSDQSEIVSQSAEQDLLHRLRDTCSARPVECASACEIPYGSRTVINTHDNQIERYFAAGNFKAEDPDLPCIRVFIRQHANVAECLSMAFSDRNGFSAHSVPTILIT